MLRFNRRRNRPAFSMSTAPDGVSPSDCAKRSKLSTWPSVKPSVAAAICSPPSVAKPAEAAAVAPLNALRYFNQVKAAESFEAADAKELGQLLVLDTDDVRGKRDPDPLEAKLRTFVDRSAVLRGARSTCPWIEVMLKEVLRNRLRVPKGSMKALEEFTEEDARKAGRGFANALVANATAEAAVDEWVMTYPALRELEQR